MAEKVVSPKELFLAKLRTCKSMQEYVACCCVGRSNSSVDDFFHTFIRHLVRHLRDVILHTEKLMLLYEGLHEDDEGIHAKNMASIRVPASKCSNRL
jgi:hypothetical protein